MSVEFRQDSKVRPYPGHINGSCSWTFQRGVRWLVDINETSVDKILKLNFDLWTRCASTCPYTAVTWTGSKPVLPDKHIPAVCVSGNPVSQRVSVPILKATQGQMLKPI
ncbi:hypothetical protein SAY86_001783 [Trapa natans]|uniref:Uncharacterized protein n=1 Tax=Trapa natans TaxID=22666 RepID=A0AAN7LI33_TRANT|nr:hypothetical protein SAY86_001783 [Trapa natans]